MTTSPSTQSFEDLRQQSLKDLRTFQELSPETITPGDPDFQAFLKNVSLLVWLLIGTGVITHDPSIDPLLEKIIKNPDVPPDIQLINQVAGRVIDLLEKPEHH